MLSAQCHAVTHVFPGCDMVIIKTSWWQQAETKLERACSCQPAGDHRTGSVGVKSSAFSVVSFCSPACRGFAKSPLPEAECCVCKWEILLSPLLIYYQWSLLCPKQNKPQRTKSTENDALDHRRLLQFLAVKFTAGTQPIFVAGPCHFLSSSPDASEHAGVRGGPGRVHSVQGSSEVLMMAPGAPWPARTHMPLRWRCWGTSGGCKRRAGAWGLRAAEGKERVSTGGGAGSCPQETATAEPVSGACWRMSCQLFQELAVILTAIFTKVGSYFQHSPGFWLCS